jgi:hypothetical protein
VLANKWAKEKEKKKPRGTGLRRGFSESQSPMGGEAPFPLPDATKGGPIIASSVLRKKNSNGVPPEGCREFEVRDLAWFGKEMLTGAMEPNNPWRDELHQRNINRSGERILPFQQLYPRGSHELSSRQQGASAWVRVWKRSSVIGAPHAPICCTARRQCPAETAKVLVIIGLPPRRPMTESFKNSRLTCVASISDAFPTIRVLF